jgi:long-chain alkane monooxygenase
VLYQAGSSPRGRQFAARHAECVFVTGPTPEVVAECIRDTRDKARQHGRKPQDLLFFMLLKVITGATEAEARRKYNEFVEYVDYEGGLALLGGWTGVDFSRFDPDQPVEYIETNAIRSLLQGFTQAGAREVDDKIRDVAKAVGIGGGGPVVRRWASRRIRHGRRGR